MTRAKKIAVEVQNASRFEPLPSPARIREWARAALGGLERGELTVRLVDEEESAGLNSRYRRRSGPTNVLAFPAETALPTGAGEAPLIGDLVVCAPIVFAEARDQGKPFEAHWAHIVIHGCLHLLGYDHQTPGEARVMEGKECELLAAFGHPDPYAVVACK